MRLIFYHKDMPNGNKATHYINLDRVECFSLPVDSTGEVTTLYAVIGENVHTLSEGKKILNPSLLLAKLLDLADRSRVNIDTCIDDCNSIEELKRKQKR